MIGEELVFFSFLYIKLFELGVEVAFNNRSAVTHHKVNLLKFPLWSGSFERADDAFVLLICFCFFRLFEPFERADLFAPVLFVLFFRFRFIIVREVFFPLSSNERISSAPFLDLHHMTQSCIVPLPVNPTTERKEGQTSLPVPQFSWHS